MDNSVSFEASDEFFNSTFILFALKVEVEMNIYSDIQISVMLTRNIHLIFNICDKNIISTIAEDI